MTLRKIAANASLNNPFGDIHEGPYRRVARQVRARIR